MLLLVLVLYFYFGSVSYPVSVAKILSVSKAT